MGNDFSLQSPCLLLSLCGKRKFLDKLEENVVALDQAMEDLNKMIVALERRVSNEDDMYQQEIKRWMSRVAEIESKAYRLIDRSICEIPRLAKSGGVFTPIPASGYLYGEEVLMSLQTVETLLSDGFLEVGVDRPVAPIKSNRPKGQKISLLTNHFGVKFTRPHSYFYHYSVAISFEDGRPVVGKGISRKILQIVQATHVDRHFAYDGAKSLFTVGSLPFDSCDFSVVLEDMPSRRNSAGDDTNDEANQSRKFVVAISYVSMIPLKAIASAHQGKETLNVRDALNVLNVMLRHSAAKQGCLLLRQSFFHIDLQNFVDIGGGVTCGSGFHSSFRTTQGGLSLNMDTSSTVIIKPGPVLDFLLANQNKTYLYNLDRNKARRVLKNLRIRVIHSNKEYKISGLSEHNCKDQIFTWRKPNDKGGFDEVEITVFNYYKERNIELLYSGDFPCINVGKPKRPTYFPIELCELVSLQRYTKSLTNFQRAALLEKSRQKPSERMTSLTNGLNESNYNNDPVFYECGVSIDSNFTRVEGRILPTPKLKVGNGEDLHPRNGRWNFSNKKFFGATKITNWAVVDFSARGDTSELVRDLIRCGKMKGITADEPSRFLTSGFFKENPECRNLSANARVKKMFELIKPIFPTNPPQFLLCILSERKNSDIYGPWKKKCLVDMGVPTQCIAPPADANDQYLTNVLLKINAKLGGLNSVLAMERSLPKVTQVPTMIVGMNVSHGSPRQSDMPSIAAVVSSREWPLLSKYKASVRTQSRNMEMVDNLFKLVSGKDEGIFRELFGDFYSTSNHRKPDHIIIFRDGVSESQFIQVLNIELHQMMQACKFEDETWDPKFTVIVAQKKHHTKFFRTRGSDNVPPGTIIDSQICHRRKNDFYLCAHASMIGTTRPTHYRVLYDEIGFSTDELQELVHSLCYASQRSTNAISVVAPVSYAHLAAAQVATMMKSEETALSHVGTSISGAVRVPPMPPLHNDVSESMFFC